MSWLNVGCHFTPDRLAVGLAGLVEEHLDLTNEKQGCLEVLDLFAGDGRLGRETSARLIANGIKSRVTFVEVRESALKGPVGGAWLNENAFKMETGKLFDIVVCNPPYQRLSREDANNLGFSWDEIRAAAQNLYCLGILKALQLCRPGGLVAAIAPFSWIRGSSADSFRQQLAGSCSETIVLPENSRRLFEGVSQDVALQLFRRGTSDSGTIVFRFKGQLLPIAGEGVPKYEPQAHFPRVRVGPLVWNRSKKSLRRRAVAGAYRVIYGGNIGSDGAINLDIPRYAGRSFVKKSTVPETFVSRGRCLLIRRTLRGNPGSWIIDSCVTDEAFCAVVENHVIVVELGDSEFAGQEIQSRIISHLYGHCYTLGNPILNTHAVKVATKLAMQDSLLGKQVCISE